MQPRLDAQKAAPAAYQAMLALETHVRKSSRLEPSLLELVRLRASQINGCAYCIDMHTKDARAIDETEQRIYALPAWRETPYFTVRERAALAFTEAVTRLADEHVPTAAYDDVAAHFSPDEVAALLAQAVVSRSFAIKNRGRWEAFGFDAYADTRDQVYLGVAVETDQAWDAVRRTAGQVLEYDGDVIDAYFHSTCGFSTAGIEEAFAAARTRPYLRPVSDDRGGGHYYCDISPRFRWREEWDASKLRAILSRTLPTVTPLSGDGLQRITDVTVSRTTRSGRVGELRIVFERGDVRIPGPDVRSVLRPEADRMLASTAFQLTVTKANGAVTRLVAAGAGSGHAVGMCQWGAIGRARAGQDYRAILTTYFPGTKIEKIY